MTRSASSAPTARPTPATRFPPARPSWCSPERRTSPARTASSARATTSARPSTPTPPSSTSRQTYASHASHQVFLREYANNPDGKPVATGKLLGGPVGPTQGGMANWAGLKAQARTLLGLDLAGQGRHRHPADGRRPLRKVHPRTGPRTAAVRDPERTRRRRHRRRPSPFRDDAIYFETPFLTDIAHNADPSPADLDHNPATPPTRPVPDRTRRRRPTSRRSRPGTYDDEMLDLHFVAGDGRVNENIGLTAVHQIFHSEHDRMVDDIKNTLTNDRTAKGIAALAEWKLAAGAEGWNGERLFQAARFVTEMEYQHLVFEEFGRKVQPLDRPVPRLSHRRLDPAITAEFAHAVYRFGHSMLTETISRTNENGGDNSIRTARRIPEPAVVHRRWPRRPADLRGGGSQHHHGHERPVRQRARRVRHRAPSATTCSACRSTSRRSTSRGRETPGCLRSMRCDASSTTRPGMRRSCPTRAGQTSASTSSTRCRWSTSWRPTARTIRSPPRRR